MLVVSRLFFGHKDVSTKTRIPSYHEERCSEGDQPPLTTSSSERGVWNHLLSYIRNEGCIFINKGLAIRNTGKFQLG